MNDNFHPLGDPSGYELIDKIQRHFEDRGWRALLGPGSRWVEHMYKNHNGSVQINYSPDERTFDFAFQSGEIGTEIYMTLPTDCQPILEVITGHQDTLSTETWPAFIRELLAVSPKVFAVTDDEDEADIELTSPEMAKSILREGEWIPMDDNEDTAD